MQPGPAPFGAKCAIHPDRSAGVVCGRCGNFMCGECAAGGALCPACLSLAGVGGGFPYTRADFDFNRLWAHAYAAWQRDWLMLSVGVLIFGAIVMGGGVVTNAINRVVYSVLNLEIDPNNPFGSVKGFLGIILVGQVTGTLVNMVVQGVGMLGFVRLIMDVLVGKKADVARMFVTLRKLPRYVVTQLIMFGMVSVPALLFMAGVFVAALAAVGINVRHLDDVRWESLLSGATFGILFAGLLVLLFVSLFVLLPLSLFPVMEIVVSECGPFEAIVRAWRIGSGLRVRLVGYAFVAWLMLFVAALLCIVPIVPVAPLAYALLVAFFLAARNGLDLPPPDHA